MEEKENSPRRQPESPHHWNFEYGFASDPLVRQGRIRASSWDDSDDNLPQIPDDSGSKTCRIYSSDDKKCKSSVSSEIDELKKEFFKNLEKEREKQVSPNLERVRVEMETKPNYDRRLSPARVRRRSKSSGSSSSLADVESLISPTKINKATEFETEVQEKKPKFLECDPNSYLSNFFTELRSRRISLLDSKSTLEKLAQVPNYDGESTPKCDESCIPDGKDSDAYFSTSRKLSKILEVEESKKDLEKSSGENISNTNLFQKCFTKPENDFSPLQTARSKKRETIPENQKEMPKKKEEKFRSLSSEYSTNFQKSLHGSLTNRSPRFFNQKLDDDFISLSAKTGKTQLAAQKRFDDKQTNTPTFSPRTPKCTDKNYSEDLENEKDLDLLKLLKIDLTKSSRSEDRTPRKSTDRSDQATNRTRTKSGKSRSWSFESPQLRLNIGIDSARSLKVEDVYPAETKPREEGSIFRKSNSCVSENSSEVKTERISQKSMRSPIVDSEISTHSSSQESEEMTNRSKSQNNTRRSYRKKRKERTENITVESETEEPNSARLVQSETKEPNCARLMQSETEEPNSARLVQSGTIERNSARWVQSETKEPSSARLMQSETEEPNFARLMRSETNSTPSGSVKTTEQHSPAVSSSSSEKTEVPKTSCRSKCSGRSPNNCEFVQTPKSKSSRTSESPKVRTPTTAENKLPDQLSHQGSPRSKKIPEFALPLDISERPESQKASHRSIQMELQDETKDSDRSETESQRRGRRRSEQRSGSRTRNNERSPRCLKMTSNTDSGSSRSKDSLDNRDEPGNLDTSWKELIKACDSNHTSTSSTRRSNERETEIFVCLSQTAEASNTLKKQLSESRNSSSTSLDSNITECLDDNSPDRTSKIKSRPNSWTSKECTPVIPPEVERLDINPISGRTGSSITEEEEDLEENHSTHRSKIGDESDRFSNKRLSVINEVSFEDLETSNVSTENEEKDTWDQSKLYSGKKSDRVSPQTPDSYKSVKKSSPKDPPNAPSWGSKEIPSIDDFTSIELDKGEEWTELISKFQTDSDSLILGKSFPGFATRQGEISWNSIKGSPLEEDNLANCDENSEETSNMKSLASKILQQNLFDRPATGEKDLDNPNLAYRNLLLDITNPGFIPSFRTHRNIHYVSVDRAEPFGIGEFGDVTCWDPGDSDIKDIEKPKDHGDGIPTQKTPEILPWKAEKTEKEVRNQRQLRRDLTDSAPLLNNIFLEAHMNHISCPLKASKSDSGNNAQRISKGSDFHARAGCLFLGDYKQKPLEEIGRTNNEVKSSRNTINQHSSSDSLEFGKDSELDYGRIPRLSRSLYNLKGPLEESLHHREPSDTLSISGDELFNKTPDRYKPEKETTNLSIFLERKNRGERIPVNSNNWLILKQGKRPKRRLKKKGAVSPSEPFHNYLSSRKTRPSVPTLKLRNPNCFQNFYKRFISVFCITSNSSAATSK